MQIQLKLLLKSANCSALVQWGFGNHTYFFQYQILGRTVLQSTGDHLKNVLDAKHLLVKVVILAYF